MKPSLGEARPVADGFKLRCTTRPARSRRCLLEKAMAQRLRKIVNPFSSWYTVNLGATRRDHLPIRCRKGPSFVIVLPVQMTGNVQLPTCIHMSVVRHKSRPPCRSCEVKNCARKMQARLDMLGGRDPIYPRNRTSNEADTVIE